MAKITLISFAFVIAGCFLTTAYAQAFNKKIPDHDSAFIETDSGTYIIMFSRGTCKNYNGHFEFTHFVSASAIPIKPDFQEQPEKKTKFLTLHGNVSYDYFYRSKVDTPVNQQNFQQHTEHIFVNALIKEKYPFKIDFSARQSNSPYFRNYFDCNFKFDRYAYQNNLKKELISKIQSKLSGPGDLKMAENDLNKNLKNSLELQNWLNSKSVLQKIIQEREQQQNNKLEYPLNIKKQANQIPFDISSSSYYKKGIQKIEKLAAGKIDTSYISAYEKNRRKLDSLNHRIQVLRQKIDSLKTSYQKNVASARQLVYGAANEKDLGKIADSYGIQNGSKDKFEKYLSNIKSFSIGKSLLNYTELTAKDITITGINVEYNPSYYAAFAIGKIDYRFRDFLNKTRSSEGQYIALGRIGIGDPDKKSLILSFFQGRKNQSEYALSDSVKNYINIFGYSLEATLKKNENTSFSAEVAKSTRPVTGNFRANQEYKSLWKFSDETNMGINIKAQTIFPETDTKISGYFRKTGENFQSFSLFSYNTDQTAWVARADQYFLKRKITITGMLRQNDFTNPFTDKSFKTTTTFKTVLLSLRFPKYPSINIGYYPGTQLYFINKEKIRENAYYILNGSMVYGYYFKNIAMNSSVVLNRYFNQATDSGFILYKGINYYLSQVLFLKKLQLQGGYSYTKQPQLEYYTIETSADFSVNKILKIGVGAKYNQVANFRSYLGERAQVGIQFKNLGMFHLQYEKSYLPTLQLDLYPVEIGRVSWTKYF